MSKFFKLDDSSSGSSESEDSDNEVPQQPVTRAVKIADFAYPSDSDDDGGQKRVVRAQKDKLYSVLKEQIRQGRNARNIKDMAKLLTNFEGLNKSYEKTKAVIAREGLTIPRFYIRYLAELEDFLNEQWEDKEGRKNMSKPNAKGLATLRQKLRKYNKDFESEIAAYREGPDPVGYSSGGGEEEEDELEAPKAQEPQAPSKKPKKTAEGSDEDSDDWKSDTEDESSESDLDLEGKQMEDLRRYFLKKEKTPKVKPDREEDEEEGEWHRISHKDDPSKPLFDPKAEITTDVVVNKLEEIVSQRGRKNTNRKVFSRHLQELYNITVEKELGIGLQAKIVSSLVSSLFEIGAKITEAMDFESWNRTATAIDGLLNLLAEHPSVQLSVHVTDEEENLSDPSKPYRLHGSVIMQIKRLDDELTKIFQQSDCHSTGLHRQVFCTLIEKAQQYVDAREGTAGFDEDELPLTYMLRIEHLYYKFTEDPEVQQLLDRLCKKVYACKKEKLQRQRALLCQIYHHALHDRWNQAKELMLMSHLQANVEHSEASTQILYNRTMCQIGLCAFRHGFIREAHQSLSEIHNTQRAKELLAQGVAPRQMDRTPEQETRERALQVPYHMHINLEVMECVYLICSMLLEIPNIACYEYDLRRRLLSRSFHYQLKFSERSPLIGPPENTREHIVAASRAMLKGDWRKCRDFIINEKMNTKVWNLFRNADGVRAMVSERIQKETLRTYLLMYSTVYTTVSFETLCNLFELERPRVYALVSKMIIQEELSATFDEPSNCLFMHRVEPSRLQLLALNLTDKLTQLAENNEQIIEPRGGRSYTGGPGNWYNQQRSDRTGDDKNRRGYQVSHLLIFLLLILRLQNDRRGGGYNQDGQGRRNWPMGGGGGGQQNRRRDQRRY
ncbi:Eukaryotic translation initiation factor 3 subunit C [Aphelenchoides fujianensis]|nr:Eukaryotic translation initiation factor 3 subunit C [Aphelenchoides fujianensis]